MLAGFSIARCFLTAGALLAGVGLLLWLLLPMRLALPPYLLTPLLALGYGFYCWRRTRNARDAARP